MSSEQGKKDGAWMLREKFDTDAGKVLRFRCWVPGFEKRLQDRLTHSCS